MQFKQYPSYKKSGVEWLGDVPEHWQVKPNKYVFKIQKRIAGTLGFNVLSITQKGLKIKDIESNAGQMAQDYSKYQIVNVGDFAMNHMDLLTGWVDIAKVTGVTSPDYRVFEVRNKKVNKEYFLHLFQLGYRNKILFAFGQGAAQMGRWRLQSETFNSLKMPFPSIEEQEKIVSFLDTETARIDTLIAKQEKLIELLEEQRKSIISHAVTKGLNPNAPMKDSGVEWLGEVPKHWEVVKSKRLFWCKGGFAFSSDDFFEEGNYPVIRISNIQDKSISTDKIVYVNSCTKKVFNQFSAYTGDLIFCMTGASLGKVGLLPKELSFALINQRVGRLDITSYAIKQFVFYLVSSHGFQTNIRMLGVGLTDNFPNISSDLIGIVDVVLPPLVEQQGIVNHLEIENSKIDTLIEKQNQLIDKLKEYRASIISHAVTGKIDVREFGA